jgi:hypothetical protein
MPNRTYGAVSKMMFHRTVKNVAIVSNAPGQLRERPTRAVSQP